MKHPDLPLQGLNIVWLKRDLRLNDHAALWHANTCGPVQLLYVVEPDYWQLKDTSARQYDFARECVQELQHDINAIGGQLIIRVGAVESVLASLRHSHGIANLFSHEEIGNDWTFQRDKRVARWCREHNIAWTESADNGITRGLKDRNQWAGLHGVFMGQQEFSSPQSMQSFGISSDAWPTSGELGLPDDRCVGRQRGGRRKALALMQSFIDTRGNDYTSNMSSPLTAENSCSRLSPYLSLGTVSTREVLHWCQNQRIALASQPEHCRSIKLRSIDSLISRIYWRSHFMQKLESEPAL